MNLHRNARLTPRGRLLLVERVCQQRVPLVAAAAAAEVSAHGLRRHRTPHHRPQSQPGRTQLVATGTESPHRLGLRTRLHRRRHPPGLRRSASRRERRPSPVSAPCCGFLRLTRHHRRTCHDRQRRRLPLRPDALACRTLGLRHLRTPALSTTHQRQSRALHPHNARRLGLRRDLRHLSRTNPSPPRLARPLQSPPTTPQPKQPATPHPLTARRSAASRCVARTARTRPPGRAAAARRSARAA